MRSKVYKMDHLDAQQKEILLKILTENEEAFQETKGELKGEPIHIRLKRDTKPYFAKQYSIPKIHETGMKKEIQRIVEIGVLIPVDFSEWGAPSFGVPKREGVMRFMSKF